MRSRLPCSCKARSKCPTPSEPRGTSDSPRNVRPTGLTAYDASEWTDLFVATAGASAALAGLVFVAVSINVDRILKFEGLPERALETVLMLLSVLLISIVGLIPGQSTAALGAELLVLGLGFGIVTVRLARRSLPGGSQPRSWLISRVLVATAATLPVIVGGASILAETGGGLYWIVAGIAIAGAVANAWVLLVEILR
jgi:modulator of FtsH protease